MTTRMATRAAKRPGLRARSFVAGYPRRLEALKRQAISACELIDEIVKGIEVPIHSVEARPKDEASAIEKIIKKGYGLPSIQITDLVGVRVICYYASDVDDVASGLKKSVEVHPDPTKSPDKRTELDVREFGYRSVHLVIRATGGQLTRHPALRDLWFEVQIRSILEHSWAEIEHDVVYKSGSARDDALIRRFSSLAAVLELTNSGFEGLRSAQRAIAAGHSTEYAAGLGYGSVLDAARLAGLMHVLLPDNPGWHGGPDSRQVAPHMAARMVDVLRFAGINNGSDLQRALGAKQLENDVADYAVQAGATALQVSHVTHLLLVIGRLDPSLVTDCFPRESTDPSIGSILGL